MQDLNELVRIARERKYSDDEIRSKLTGSYAKADLDKALGSTKPAAVGMGDVKKAESQAKPLDLSTRVQNKVQSKTLGPFSEASARLDPKIHLEDILAELGGASQEGAAATLGIASGISSLNPVMGNATYSVTRNLLDATNKKLAGTPMEESEFLGNTAKDFAFAEVGGRVLSKAGKLIKGAYQEATKPGSVVGDFATKTKQTFSQMAGKGEFVEDVLNPAAKKAAVKESFQLAEQEAEDLVAKVTGVDLKFTDDVARQASKLTEISKGNYDLATKVSGKYGDVAQVIAERNPVQFGPKLVNGPIPGDETFKIIESIDKEIADGILKPDANDKLLSAVARLKAKFNPVYDETGALVSKEPISFRDSWDFKKELQKYVQEKYDARASYLKEQYSGLTSALNKDIEAGIGTWTQNPDQALHAWKRSKEIAGNRDASFFPDSSKGSAGKLKLDEVQDNVDEVKALLNDSVRLQHFLNSNDRDILLKSRLGPNGKPMVISLANTNAKRELGATKLQMMFNDAKREIKGGGFEYDTRKLQEIWNANEKSDVSKILYNSDTRANISQFIKELSNIDQEFNHHGNFFLKMQTASKAIYFGSALINAGFGASIPTGGLAAGAFTGAMIGLPQLTKLLIKPESARILAGAVKGGPLGMSQQLASRILLQNAVGMKMMLKKQDGSTVNVTVDQNGKFKETN